MSFERTEGDPNLDLVVYKLLIKELDNNQREFTFQTALLFFDQIKEKHRKKTKMNRNEKKVKETRSGR